MVKLINARAIAIFMMDFIDDCVDFTDAPTEIKVVCNSLTKLPLTKEQILKAGISEGDLEKAVKDKYVQIWDACVDEPLYYVEGWPSEVLLSTR